MKKAFIYLFSILLAVIICNDQLISQQQAPGSEPEYLIGAFKIYLKGNRHNPLLYERFEASGMNTFWGYIGDTTKIYLQQNNINVVIGDNEDGPQELIRHYSSAFYSRWEAEEDETDKYKVGVKHRENLGNILGNLIGSPATYLGNQCWSSIGLTEPKDSLMYGPHYHQQTVYNRYYFDPYHKSDSLEYIPRFRMALVKHPSVNDNEDVCIIKVVHRYTKYTLVAPDTFDLGVPYEDILRIDTLKVSRFNSDGSFSDIYFEEKPDRWYRYDSRFKPYYRNGEKGLFMRPPPVPQDSAVYNDMANTDNGIQFRIDWLRNDELCTLYIDYVEVYDNFGWNRYLNNPEAISDSIRAYAQNMNFNNLKYFAPVGEPNSIDAIIPIKTVTTLMREATQKPINLAMTIPTLEYWPPVNGERLYKRIIDAIEPETMLNNYFPFYVGWDLPKSYEYLRAVLQENHNVFPDFWYCAQSEGYRTNEGNGED